MSTLRTDSRKTTIAPLESRLSKATTLAQVCLKEESLKNCYSDD